MSDLDTMRRDRNRALDRLRKRRITLAQVQGIPTSLVDARPIRARLLELNQLGYSFEAIAATHGAGTAAGLHLIATGAHQRAERKFETVAHLPVTLNVHPNVGDSMWVPTLGAQRRLRSLMRLGWRHEDVAEIVGRSTHVLVGNSAPHRTRAIDWRLIDAAWQKLSATPGPSVKSRTRAERMGYAPPLAWDDIDDPRETPSGAGYLPLDRGEAIDDMAHLGYSLADVCRALKIGPEALEKWCGRSGRIETYRALVARERGAA